MFPCGCAYNRKKVHASVVRMSLMLKVTAFAGGDKKLLEAAFWAVMMVYFRDNIEALQGYAPGFQPKEAEVVKLNTNENPYRPSPKVMEALTGHSVAWRSALT